MKLWWLMLAEYSYLPIPRRWQAERPDLPRALFLLPLWGLLAGLLLLLCARFAWLLGSRWQAGLLLGLQILLNGGVWLRDLMLVADGRQPPLAVARQAQTPDTPSVPPPHRPQVYGRTALIVGCLYLLLTYWCYFWLLRRGYSLAVLVAFSVLGRWLYCWGVYDFAALAPAFLKRGGELRHFRWASVFSLLVVAVCAWFASALWWGLVVSLLAALLLYRSRLHALGALDEPCYGAAAAWGELALLLAYLLFVML